MNIIKRFWKTYISCSLTCPTCNKESGIWGSSREGFKPTFEERKVYTCKNCGEKLIDVLYQFEKRLMKVNK